MENQAYDSSPAKAECSPNELLFTLSQFIRRYQKGMYRARLPFVPHRGQNRVLQVIADHDGLNQKELAELLEIRSASISELLNKLERANLITRERNEADKRIQHVFLSAEGREKAERSQQQDAYAQMLFGDLTSEERNSFYATLKKLNAVFEVQELLDEDEPDEPLPPHLREHPLPPEGPLPPHLREHPLPPHLREHPLPLEGELPPHLQK